MNGKCKLLKRVTEHKQSIMNENCRQKLRGTSLFSMDGSTMSSFIQPPVKGFPTRGNICVVLTHLVEGISPLSSEG